MFPSSRPTASSLKRRLSWTAGACVAVLGLAASPALAKKSAAVAAATETPATCEGQVFSQPFLAYGDSAFYTLVPGGEFKSASEGWTLSGGASVISATLPEGGTGGALNLPSGAKAESPPMCVTLAYPTAKAWVDGAKGSKGVNVFVSYAGTASAITPQEVVTIKAKHGTWTLGKFAVEPSLAGTEDAPREVRFIFEGGSKGATELYDVYVDPRMK